MLAGPPPSFNTASLPSTMQLQPRSSSQMYPNRFQTPVFPPNFPGNPQYQSPVLPPNFPDSQHQSYSQPSMMTNEMSMISTNLHFKYTIIYLF